MAATKTATQVHGKKKLVGRSSLSLRHKRKKPWDKKRNHCQAQQPVTNNNNDNTTTLIQNCIDDDSHWNNNNTNDCDLIYNRLPRTLLELKYKNKLKDKLSQQMIISRSIIHSNNIYGNAAPAVVRGLSKKSVAQNSTPTVPSKMPLSTTNKHDCLPNLVEDSSESCCSSIEEAQSSSWEYDSPSTSRRSSKSSNSEFPSIPNAMEEVSTVTPNRRQDTDKADTAAAAAAADAIKAITPSPHKKIPRALLELASFNDVGNENCEPTRHKRIGKSNQQFGFSNQKQHRPIPSNYAFLLEECNSDVRKLVRKYGNTTNEAKPKNKRGRRKQLWTWED